MRGGEAVTGARRGACRVAVLGGGVAGLTAAMELAERGFEVTVDSGAQFLRRAGWLRHDRGCGRFPVVRPWE
ncbi:FAD-dependent oxidoreductase [Streptomyces sp. NPDC088554]|uniref:FAD-dependent oxidoreductase n=1 Tax=Streptomyces sp. NPDC088554 TaxID=3365865 RepID=UPI003826E421